MIYNKYTKRGWVAILALMLFAGCTNDDGNNTTDDPDTEDNIANKQPLGTSANDLLSADNFTSLRVEIAYPDGFRPTDTTIDLIEGFLAGRLDKPDGITIVENLIENPSQTGPYDINEIVEIEDEYRTVFNTEDEIGVWMFFSDQSSSSDSGNSVVLGTAYRNTSVVMFERTFIELANNSPTPINRSLIETATLRHEMGHIFGLVNVGTPLTSDHEDAVNTRHCIVEECLMFFETVTNSFNTSDINAIPDFDPLCIADLQANGGL
jgi:hypothetical protein